MEGRPTTRGARAALLAAPCVFGRKMESNENSGITADRCFAKDEDNAGSSAGRGRCIFITPLSPCPHLREAGPCPHLTWQPRLTPTLRCPANPAVRIAIRYRCAYVYRPAPVLPQCRPVREAPTASASAVSPAPPPPHHNCSSLQHLNAVSLTMAPLRRLAEAVKCISSGSGAGSSQLPSNCLLKHALPASHAT